MPKFEYVGGLDTEGEAIEKSWNLLGDEESTTEVHEDGEASH